MITKHALERYQERIANIPDDEVEQRLLTPTMRLALQWAGQCTVRLSGGERCVVKDGVIVTVLPRKARSVRFSCGRKA